eukprot:2720203-Prymnesium_polylepis.1
MATPAIICLNCIVSCAAHLPSVSAPDRYSRQHRSRHLADVIRRDINRCHSSLNRPEQELAVQEKFANVSILTSIIKQDLAQGQASAPMQNPSTRKSSINTMFGATVDAKLPCSSMQHQLILHQQLQPQSTAYNEPVTVSFDGYLNEPIARSALQVLVRRHAVLRTYFAFDTRANVFYQ